MKLKDPRSIRLRLGLNQSEFWGRVGVTQSGGSRYERDRRIPKAVQELIRVHYIDKIDLSKITRKDVEILAYLKSKEPELYRRLRQEAKAAD